MTTPNTLTLARFILALVGCAALLAAFPFHYTFAFLIFITAALTDYFDGKLARERHQISAFGAFMDPLADKLLVFLYFTHFTVIGVYPEWLFAISLTRDLLIDGFRNFAASKNIIVSANQWSKWKTALQMCSLNVCLLSFTLPEFFTSRIWSLGAAVAVFCMMISFVCGCIGSAEALRKHTAVLLKDA